MNVDWYIYVAFLAFVVAMLLVDLKLFHAEGKEATVAESATWVGVWVALAVAFGLILWAWMGAHASGEYFAGYLIEYSLSVDNMFVFILIFAYFSVPRAYQHHVLFYGILGAIVFRGVFILLGTALITNFEWVIYVFGAFLIYTAIRIGLGGTDEIHPERNRILNWVKKRFPVSEDFRGQALVAWIDARRVLTPLFIVLVFIEITDVLFALDSIPAIFAVTRAPFIVFSSNVFAILGLRALYFLIAGAMDRLHLLNYGLAVILGFVGVKMLLEAADVVIPIWSSLVVIVGVLAATAVLSLMLAPRERGKQPKSD
ncbi:MAG: tellurite resistance protein TerC [Actinomycetota bacterium]|nr:tellurite resistance protein TerC [Actinomycetota bacterium]